jgi:hypothetical protein
MLWNKRIKRGDALVALITAAILAGLSSTAAFAQQPAGAGESSRAALRWTTQARERRTPLLAKARGRLAIGAKGVEFRSAKGREQRWAYQDIHTAFIGPHRLDLETYQNRSWHRPGAQRYRFNLASAMPPAVAAALAAKIARPVQNADPDPNAPACATIPVRHRMLTGGTNGVLRFRAGGIDYVTKTRNDSRSWSWADLQTLSDPDPYHLFIFGYRDTYTFDLKAPLSRALFNHATDAIFAHSESAPMSMPGSTNRTNLENTGAGEKR